VHGRWGHSCSGDGDLMHIDGQAPRYSGNKAIPQTDWSGCDIVIEAA